MDAVKGKDPKGTAALLKLQAAVMLFGISGVIGKGVRVSAITLTGGRVLCSSLLLLLFLGIRRQPLRAKSRRDTGLTILAGILLAVHWITFFASVQMASVAIGTITYSTFPLFLIVLEPLLYREERSIRHIFLTILLLAGVYLTLPSFSLADKGTMGVLYGMVCSLTYALLTLCNRSLSKRYSGFWVSFREQSVAAVLLFPVLLFRRETVSVTDFAGICTIGILCTAIGFSIFVSAQKQVSAQTAGICAGMETVYGIGFAFFFLGEVPLMRELLGGALILMSSAVFLLPTRGPEKE